MFMEILTYKENILYVLENESGKYLIFPKEYVVDLDPGIDKNKILIKCEHGLIPIEDLRLVNITDKIWIEKTHDFSEFEVKMMNTRKVLNV